MVDGGLESANETEAVDLTNCDREPIHIPGSVQPHGVMLVIDPASQAIAQAAGPTLQLLGFAIEDLLGRPLADRLPADGLRRLEGLLGTAEHPRPLHLLDFCECVEDRPLDASVHHSGGQMVLELELAARSDPRSRDPLAIVQEMLSGLNETGSIVEFCQEAAKRLRRATAYDRVMVYRFLPDGSGSVVAEDCEAGMEPYLGLRYPASDIPLQARALYARSWLRIIGAVDYEPAPLMPALNPQTMRPLDMSHATLRSVSPIHLQYLKNMGVSASMSISVMRGGDLWGLVVCHHRTPLFPKRHLRAACELFGQLASFQLEARERAEALEYRHQANAVHAMLVGRMLRADDLASGLTEERPTLLDYLESDGVAVLIDGNYSSTGRCPRESQVRALAAWLDRRSTEGLFFTDALSEVYEPGREFAADASGVLSIAASRNPTDYILWFRPELVETVHWAGNPEKPVERASDNERLTPRKSFETWSQRVRQRSKPWNVNEIEAAGALRLSLLEIVLRRLDQVATARAQAERRHQTMIAELNHRVKNTLATIQALAHHTKRTSSSLEAYVKSFEQRIQAMSSSHNLLTDASWERLPLKKIVEAQVKPYAASGNVFIDGPPVDMDPRSVAPIGMMLHELATNAAKYGALSGAGSVSVTWSLLGEPGDQRLELHWRESGGPPVRSPTREGFGAFTLRRLVPFQVGGGAVLRYDVAGFECDVTLDSQAFLPSRPIVDEAGLAPDAPSVLVVEDEALVAFQVERVARSLGWRVVGPINRVALAETVARTEPLDGAILDVNVGGELIWPVAALLRARGVPMLFATGYDRSKIMIPEFAETPTIGKPFEDRAMAELITSLFSRGG